VPLEGKATPLPSLDRKFLCFKVLHDLEFPKRNRLSILRLRNEVLSEQESQACLEFVIVFDHAVYPPKVMVDVPGSLNLEEGWLVASSLNPSIPLRAVIVCLPEGDHKLLASVSSENNAHTFSWVLEGLDRGLPLEDIPAPNEDSESEEWHATHSFGRLDPDWYLPSVLDSWWLEA
jgi:hypothetical protein